jgi:hypothetical protein
MKKSEKRKEEEKSLRSKKVLITKEASQDVSREESQRREELTLWKDDIQALESLHFASLEEAVASLVERVLNRLETPAALESETRDFLTNALLTDKLLIEDLRKSLRIAER